MEDGGVEYKRGTRRGKGSECGRGKGADGLLSDSRKEAGLEGGSLAARRQNSTNRAGEAVIHHGTKQEQGRMLLCWQLAASGRLKACTSS